MKRITASGWMLAMLAGIMFAASPALAQQRTSAEGHAADANPRIGSGGFNDGTGNHPQPGVLGNAIVNGTVTGGQAFRGFVPYSDPGAFTGNAAFRPSEFLVQNGTGVTTGGTLIDNSNALRLFYGDSRQVAPPPGFSQMGYNGSYIQSPMAGPSLNDSRLGQSTRTVYPSQTTNLMLMPGPLDPNNNPSLIMGSSLTGVRTLSAANPADVSFLASNSGAANSADIAYQHQLQSASIAQLRSSYQQEMGVPTTTTPLFDANGNPVPKTNTGTLTPGGQNTQPGAGTASTANGNAQSSANGPQPLNAPLTNAPITNASITGNAISNPPINNSAVGSNANVQITGTSFAMVPAIKQSSQYAMLRARLDAQFGSNANPAVVNAQIHNAQVRDQQTPNNGNTAMSAKNAGTLGTSANKPGAPGSTATPGQGITPGNQNQAALPNNAQPAVKKAAKPPVPMIESLSPGIQSKTLQQVMSEAETEMKAGRWLAAMDQYDVAAQIAPNNTFVPLGRAYAELGASYYTQAESHLRQVLSTDQTLMMGRFDLAKMIGKDRLEYIVADLKGLASNDTKSSRPVFLLAYIYYNQGDTAAADGYLTLAEKRSGGQDPLFKTLRARWDLEPAGQEMNK